MRVFFVKTVGKTLKNIQRDQQGTTALFVCIQNISIKIHLEIDSQNVADLWSLLILIIKKIKAIWSNIGASNVIKKYSTKLLLMIVF